MPAKIVFVNRFKHEYLPGHYYFITYRIINSATKVLYRRRLKNLDEELEDLKKQPITEASRIRIITRKKQIKRINSRLKDPHYKPNLWLALPQIRDVLKENLHFNEGKFYELAAYSIMPNHVHVILKPFEFHNMNINYSPNLHKCPLSYIVYKIKRYSATMANRILSREGQFWREEYHSILIKNEEQFKNMIIYTLLNPVKGGLCKDKLNNPYNYLNPEYKHLLERVYAT